MNERALDNDAVRGQFIDFSGERYYAIRNVDKMAPFFVSVVSNDDHWLFISSTGGLTAGRVSPDTALFPYITVDKIHESTSHTGSKTMLRVDANGKQHEWEPFNREHDGRFAVTRNLYKNLLGNKLCFEEINQDLGLTFRYTWVTSDEYGFVRRCELENLGDRDVAIELVDGLQNILPAGAPRFAQTNTSNLVDAYKWTELDEQTGLAVFTLYSGITDRAEPCESLKANTAFCLGLDGYKVLISSDQINAFRVGDPIEQEVHKRGIRGAYLVNCSLKLGAKASREWQIVADIEQSQSRVIELQQQLGAPQTLADAISQSVSRGSDGLARIMASGDGFQITAEENVTSHHYANVLFNILRGGVFDDQYNISSWDFSCTIGEFNKDVHRRNEALFKRLPDKLAFGELLDAVKAQGDAQLDRLCHEYLPIRFGRRHGDPSRPWNQYAIRLQDEHGNRLLSYEGNWRDIFQNWEALSFSYPEFVENIIAKFVNASTMDGYNPYRITKEGIDWEVEEPDDPWSYIGYWGDHQIIYLQKLLELSEQFHPARLGELLHAPIFCYANVPYRIKAFDALLDDPKSTVTYNEELAEKIEERVTRIGADGKLVLDANGAVYQVNLLEKLLVPLLAKLGNLVIDGGIWMNTQRPEWNDANNALVGHGLSMVTLYYLRRYVSFLRRLLASGSQPAELSSEVSRWLAETGDALAKTRSMLGNGPVGPDQRFESLAALGEAASRYRQSVYEQESFSGKQTQPLNGISAMLDDALVAIDHSIAVNRRSDGLFHAYNLLARKKSTLSVDTLYPMLEGQVAALSSGAISGDDVIKALEALFESDVYRPDQQTFMLYPDRPLPKFLDKNRMSQAQVDAIPLLQRMLAAGDSSIVERDPQGSYRFNADFTNVGDLNDELDRISDVYGSEVDDSREALAVLFETVFHHQAFTGRSGTMFGFEGLGCVYWHMVSKLLLAVQENFFQALGKDAESAACHRLGELYYRVREGIGFNKTPAEFGAFPTDPYSHTPKHAGAKQPGMTGQVKEEILTRFGELGVRVSDGAVHFLPGLLRAVEFTKGLRKFCYLDVRNEWRDLEIPAAALAFTWCQVPVVYELADESEPGLVLLLESGATQAIDGLALNPDASSELFRRSGQIRQITATFDRKLLFAG